ncbi:MAG: polyprenyl synthetase family protein [Syntrophaceae bacterium]|nr:polyprenyl synthetase family protein [Syntrophaceae bacterium]
MKAVEADMARNFFSEISMIPTVSRYLISSGGKRFRPLLLLLSARLCGHSGPRAVPLASSIEFIHTATLLHDDVVDRAFLRRGLASANSVYGDGASVLVGDFLFTKAFSMIVGERNLPILEVISQATTRMAEGEVMQLTKMGNPETTEEDYRYVVINKTAVLISAACRIGGILGGVPQEKEKALAAFGLNVGIAFQLMDDTLDYIAEEKTLGKTIGKDLSEGKVTLPLIHALRTAPAEGQDRLRAVIRNRDRTEEDLRFVMQAVQDSGGIGYTVNRAADYVNQGRNSLSVFSPAPEKEALLAIAEYTLKRNK